MRVVLTPGDVRMFVHTVTNVPTNTHGIYVLQLNLDGAVINIMRLAHRTEHPESLEKLQLS